jgi:tRNA-specific 2-thiouridylase
MCAAWPRPRRAAPPRRRSRPRPELFLYGTTQEQLDFLRFPLGGMPKPQVRALAQAMGLAVAAKPDSQDICFVPDGDYAKIVRSVRPEGGRPGAIVHAQTGAELGRHQGVIHYTVGQRRGWKSAVSPSRSMSWAGCSRRACWSARAPARRGRGARGRNQPHRRPAQDGTPLTAKVRSLAKPVPVTLDGPFGDGAATVLRFATPEYGVAPGQAAVLYAGDRVIGGGWIDSTEPAEVLVKPSLNPIQSRQAATGSPSLRDRWRLRGGQRHGWR